MTDYTRMTGRKPWGVLIDEIVEVTGHERKHASKVRRVWTGVGGGPAKRKGRPADCGEEVQENDFS